ncbi:MAG: hypothetical protein HOV66_22460 [Streptomycetaceae bacterium]|jgi:hypothetical protein|nr:hypothetical protein [Streptomycetaceae bacterium]
MNVFRTRRSVAAIAGLVVAGSLVLTGCNDSKKNSGEKNNPDPGPPSGVSTAAASNGSSAGSAAGSSAGSSSVPTAPTSAANGGGSGSDSGSGGAAVKPGTVLKLGQAATLDYVSGSKKSTISINVTSIDAGSPADLSSLKLTGGSVQGMTPFYIKYTVTNAGTTDLSYSSASSMHGLLADGGMANPLILFGGSIPQCADSTAPSGFTQGKSYQTCVIALAPTGSKVAGAEWIGEPYEKLHDGVSWGVKAR